MNLPTTMPVFRLDGGPIFVSGSKTKTVDELQVWLETSSPGERIEYHRGCLPLDRTLGFSELGEQRRHELNVIADRVQALAKEGRLILVQKRHGEGDYGYLAIKLKSKPRRNTKPPYPCPGGRRRLAKRVNA